MWRRDQLSLTLILGDALDNEKLFFQSDLYTCGYNVTSPQSGVLDIEWVLSLSQIHMWVQCDQSLIWCVGHWMTSLSVKYTCGYNVTSPQSGVLDIEWVISLSQIHMWVQCDQSSSWCVGHWMTSLSQSNTHVGTMWPVLNLVCWTLNEFSLSVKYTCGYNVTSPQSGVLDIEWVLSFSQIHMWVQCDQSPIWCFGHLMSSLSQSNTHVGTMWPVLNLVC